VVGFASGPVLPDAVETIAHVSLPFAPEDDQERAPGFFSLSQARAFSLNILAGMSFRNEQRE